MLFNSIDFMIFLPVVFTLYWLIGGRNIGRQNLLIVSASYIFYGWWDWRFLILIFISTVIDYSTGFMIYRNKEQARRKFLLCFSIFANIGFLLYFKYCNFFIDSFVDVFSFFGNDISAASLNVVLPVGISFYTFQTLSYSIDIYRKKIKPETNFIAFASFVSFFPQLVAGPIERAASLLPQFCRERSLSYNETVNGLRQILWGFVKKVLIADNCAIYANLIFETSAECSGSTLLLGVIFFAFQIYGDFSGYSDIAIGTARLFGFSLMRNFAFPYFSRDIAEFWRRWHISLTTWFRDYLYIPLGGSRGSTWIKVRNIFVIFVVSGFWHGAKWTFIFWGVLNALLFLPLLLSGKNRGNLGTVSQGRLWPSVRDLLNMLLTFGLVLLGWVFFRAESLSHALNYLAGIFSRSILTVPDYADMRYSLVVLLIVFAFLIVEWLGRDRQYALEGIAEVSPQMFRWSTYSFLIFLLGMYCQTEETPFIYFQF